MAEQLPLFGFDADHVATWSPRDIWLRLNACNIRAFGEDRRVERKTATTARHHAEVAEYYSMWSNTVEGGLILFGVEDDGVVSGASCLPQSAVNRLESFHVQMCPDARPEFKRIAVQIDRRSDFVIAIFVPYRGFLVETQRGEAFIRQGDTKHKMTPEEKDDFRSTRHERSWEQRSSSLVYPADFDNDILSEFCDNFRNREDKHGWKNVSILVDRHLLTMENNHPVALNALVLFAARDPRRTVPGSRVRVQRFIGTEEGSGSDFAPIRDFYIEGNIPRILQDASKEINSLNYDVTWLNREGKFVTTTEYPQWAWFEAVVNALVHRSYSFSGSEVTVKFFADRLEVESPGGFVPPVNAHNVYSQRASRNPHLMEALRYLGFVRMTREGTRRMKESMEAWNLPAPTFSQEAVHGVSVRVTLRNDHEIRKRSTDKDVATYCGVEQWRKLAEHEIVLVGYAFNNKKVQVAEVQRLTGRTWNTTKKDLDKLVAKGLLEFVEGRFARDPKAHYTIVQNRGARNGAERER